MPQTPTWYLYLNCSTACRVHSYISKISIICKAHMRKHFLPFPQSIRIKFWVLKVGQFFRHQLSWLHMGLSLHWWFSPLWETQSYWKLRMLPKVCHSIRSSALTLLPLLPALNQKSSYVVLESLALWQHFLFTGLTVLVWQWLQYQKILPQTPKWEAVLCYMSWITEEVPA